MYNVAVSYMFKNNKNWFMSGTSINGILDSYTIYVVDNTGKTLNTIKYNIKGSNVFEFPIPSWYYENYIPIMYVDLTQKIQVLSLGIWMIQVK